MRKLKLNADAVTVDTFTTQEPRPKVKTVVGHQDSYATPNCCDDATFSELNTCALDCSYDSCGGECG